MLKTIPIKITEKSTENTILTYLKNKRIFVWKNNTVGVYDPVRKKFRRSHNPHHINGVSDILGVYNGKFLAIEVKRPSISTKTGQIKHRTQEELEKLASDEQIEFVNHIKRCGGIAFFADSIDTVEEQLKLGELAI